MNKANLGFLLGLGFVLGTAMCQYKPDPKSGAMSCAASGKRCPSGYECSPVNSKCYRPEDLPEVPLSTGGTTTASTPGAGGATGGASSISSSKPPTIGGQVAGATVTSKPSSGGSAGASTTSTTIAGGTTSSTTIRVGGSSVICTTSIGGAGGSPSSKAGAGGTSSSGTAKGGTASGGALVSTAGTTSAGGVGGTSTSGPPAAGSVTFKNGKAFGAMTGYGWVGCGSADSVSDPLCGTKKFVPNTACPALTWTSKDALCLTGSIPALDASNPDYTNNWGISFGVNATEAVNGTLAQSYSSISFTLTGAPLTGLRAQVHKKGDPENVSYCAALTSGAVLPLTSFTTACYDTLEPGTALTAADVPEIDKINVQVHSDVSAITVSNLCLTGITLTK
jgi:hypothetical protein